MERTLNFSEVRNTLSELLEKLSRKGGSYTLTNTINKRPMFSLESIDSADQGLVAVAVAVGPDAVRKRWAMLRAVVLADNIPLVIKVDKLPVALLRRHPDYNGADQIASIQRQYRENVSSLKSALSGKQTVAKPATKKQSKEKEGGTVEKKAWPPRPEKKGLKRDW